MDVIQFRHISWDIVVAHISWDIVVESVIILYGQARSLFFFTLLDCFSKLDVGRE
jgi:hypothetical protein